MVAGRANGRKKMKCVQMYSNMQYFIFTCTYEAKEITLEL